MRKGGLEPPRVSPPDDTGLRITKAFNLQRDHIQFQDELPCSIHIVKGKSKNARREIPLTERASLTLAASLEHSRCAYAFMSRGGRKPITRHYPSEQFLAVRMRSASVLSVFYTRPGTRSARPGKAGADAFTIQRLAGHSSITISQRYVLADRGLKETAIRLLDALNQPKIEA